MWKRKLVMAAVAASSIAWMPLPASAEIYIDVAPPPPRHEVIPQARPGYVWAQGHWRWENGRHVWVRGHWIKARRGMYWHPDRWEEVNGHYVYRPGRWDRDRWAENRGAYGDRDHDGVPNQYDRDRDNDGVPNRFDSAPNNPYRQ